MTNLNKIINSAKLIEARKLSNLHVLFQEITKSIEDPIQKKKKCLGEQGIARFWKNKSGSEAKLYFCFSNSETDCQDWSQMLKYFTSLTLKRFDNSKLEIQIAS